MRLNHSFISNLPLTALFFAATVCAAQTAAPSQGIEAEIRALKNDHEAIKEELAAIKKLLEPKKPPPFEPVELSIGDWPSRGNESAGVVLVEFTDYQCPFCARHFRSTFPKILETYVETGKLRYVVRGFPLTQIHPHAAKATEAALCAGNQGKYWQMHEKLFQNQKKLSEPDLARYAKALGLDEVAFSACMSSGEKAGDVREGLKTGSAAGLRGTPSFLLGRVDPQKPDTLRATELLRGAQPFEAFQAAIEKLLRPERARGRYATSE